MEATTVYWGYIGMMETTKSIGIWCQDFAAEQQLGSWSDRGFIVFQLSFLCRSRSPFTPLAGDFQNHDGSPCDAFWALQGPGSEHGDRASASSVLASKEGAERKRILTLIPK